MADEGEQKLYLQEPLLECRIPEPDLIFLSDLPGGLDYNEWLASHSKFCNEIVRLLSLVIVRNAFIFSDRIL